MRPESITDRVHRASVRERTWVRASVALVALAVAATAGAGALRLLGNGRWISLPPLLPVAVLAAIGMLAAIIAFAGWRRARRVTLAEFAAAIEEENALRRGSLRGLLEVGTGTALSSRAAGLLGRSLPSSRLAPRRERFIRGILVSAMAMLLLGAAGFTWSGVRHPDALDVLRHPLGAARGDLLVPLSLRGAPEAAAPGTRVTLEVVAGGRSSVDVYTREPGSPWRGSRHAVERGLARVQLDPLSAVTMVFAADARGTTDTVTIRALQRPFVRELRLEAVYPVALRRPSEPLTTVGQLLLPEGTTLRVRGTASVPLASAALRGSNGSSGSFAVTGESFFGTHPVHAGGALEWHLLAVTGEVIDPPPALHVTVLADLLPEVEILAPAADTTVAGDAPVRVVVRARDDHELSGVVLRVRHGTSESTLPLAIPPAGGSATVALDLSTASPGARVSVDAVATEGPGSGRQTVSARRTIRLMTAAEQRVAARITADSAAALAAGVVDGQRQTERRTAEAARARAPRRDETALDRAAAGHALASRARSLVDEQRGLVARADSLAAATQAMEARLARAGALDQGLAARLAEVRLLLRRALTPELAARLRDAEQAVRDDAEEPLRRSLADIAREQRRAREQLERIVQMLRRAAIEGALETLRAEATELSAAPVESAPRVRRLETDIAGVLERLAAEEARAGVAPTQRALQAAVGAGTAAARRDSAAAGDELRRAASSLADARSAQIGEWKADLAADVDAAVQELVQLAGAEEALANRVARGSTEWRGEHAILEEAAAVVAERVARAARTSTLISSRSDGLVRAARDQVIRVSAPAFPPRDRTQTSSMMREAAASMARAAASLVRDRERTNTARSASGFTELLEELQRLAEQQRGLNSATASLPLDLLAGGGAARETARTLARQQRALARALDELGDADAGARAQPLAAEAHRIADALERAAVDVGTIARQERLYHRLLEGGRLLTGDSGPEDDRREGVAARSAERALPAGGALPAVGRRYLVPGWAELSGLTPAERQMIVEYFERLNASGPGGTRQ